MNTSRAVRLWFLLCAALVVLPCVSSCGSLPGSSQGKAYAWKFIPMSIESSPGESGWKNYTLYMAVENQGTKVAYAPTEYQSLYGTVATKEGVSYSTERFVGPRFTVVPPKFRMPGFVVKFRAAETTTPEKIKIADLDTVDLGSIQKPTFPTDEPRPSFKNMGDSIEVAQAKITVTREPDYEKGVVVNLDIENLDRFKDNELYLPACAVFDGNGVMVKIDEDAFGWRSFDSKLGPAQKKQFKIGYIVDKQSLNNAKFVCWKDQQGNEPSFNFLAMFNLD